MPELYEKMRDNCLERKRKKKDKLSKKDIQECKKMAAILYYKKTGKPAQHADAKEIEMDDVDLDIMMEQLDIFGSLENYENFNK